MDGKYLDCCPAPNKPVRISKTETKGSQSSAHPYHVRAHCNIIVAIFKMLVTTH